jgi:hypothetical protein
LSASTGAQNRLCADTTTELSTGSGILSRDTYGMIKGKCSAKQRSAGKVAAVPALESRGNLPLAFVGEDFVGTDDLPVQRAGNQRFPFDLPMLCVRDRDLVHFQGAPHGAFVVRFSFH